MVENRLDDVDTGILDVLQDDARNISTEEIGNRVGVSASTVRNRMKQLEDDGVLVAYQPVIDYRKAGYPFQVLLVCTAPPGNDEVYSELLDLYGVVSVRQTLTSRRNLHVQTVGTDASDILRSTNAVAQLGVEVERTDIVRQVLHRPFNHLHLGDNRNPG